MIPKPFPFPIEVGVDICRTARIASLLRQERTRNRWAQRVFTRLEWPALVRRFQRVDRADGETYRQAQKRQQQLRYARQEAKEGMGIMEQDIWMLPKLSTLTSILDNQEAYWSAIGDDRSRLGILARHLAGRWAAKEAVIKAHRHRQLFMQDISIVYQRSSQATDAITQLVALIDPVCDTIEMYERVASERQLRGFGPRSQGLYKGALIGNADDIENTHGQDEKLIKKAPRFHRRAKVRSCDRQVAKINISHDGDYAVAVCMAFDPPGMKPEEKRIGDNGGGPPKHEPQWGDEGWFDVETEAVGPAEEEKIDEVELKKLKEEQNSVHSPEQYKIILQEALEGCEEDSIRRLPPLPGIESSSMAKLGMSKDKALYFYGGIALIAASLMPELASGGSYKLTVKDSDNPQQVDFSPKGTV